MRRGKILCAWLTVLMLALACMPAMAEGNLIQNGDFEQIGANGLPDGWTKNMWHWEEGVSYLSVEEGGYDGGNCVVVENADTNDARFEQTVSVTPGSMYVLRCMVKAENCPVGEAGAGISVSDTFESSDYVYDTQGEWVELELYGVAGEDQHQLTVMARVGGYSSLNSGKAWFDNFTMEEVDEAPEGVYVADFSTTAPASNDTVEVEENEVSSGGMLILISAIFVVLFIVAATRVSQNRLKLGRREKDVHLVLICLLLAALVVRLLLAALVRGYEVDMNCFEAWAQRMWEVKPWNFYSDEVFCDYPPAYLLVLWLVGALRNLLGLPYDGPATWVLIKLTPILCDMVGAYLVYRLLRRSLGENVAALLSLLYALNPAAILNSAAWGQVDSVLTLLLLITLIQAVKGRWMVAMPVYMLAVLVKPQALLLAPLALGAMVLEIVKTKDMRAALRQMGIGLALVAGVLAVMLALFTGGQGLGWLIELYRETLNSYAYFTVNAMNVYTLFGMNWQAIPEGAGMTLINVAIYLVIFGYGLYLYIKSGDHRKLFLVGALILIAVFNFGFKMHERYVFPAMLLLLVAYGLERDIRLLAADVLLMVSQFINIGMVLQNEHLQSAQWLLNDAIGLMNLAILILVAVTAWQICVSGRRMELGDRISPISQDNAAAASLLKAGDDYKLHITRWDVLLMAALTLAYGITAFVNLGDTQAPQTSWTSSAPEEQIVFDLGQERTFHMTYYGGICDTSFTVEFSQDGENWSEPHWAEYNQGTIFRWLWYVPQEIDENGEFYSLDEYDEDGNLVEFPMQTARYVRLTAERVGLVLSEVAFIDENGTPYPITSVASSGGNPDHEKDPAMLIDEQDTVPAMPSYYNGTYFDEIYHARTAYEHLHGLQPYEYTHPPLGKDLMMIGIALFGMTPFGWRFMGTIMGILMVPVMYLLVKQLVKRTDLSFIGCFLMTFDCMHFTQTRIATIDSYAVLFIMVMYLFMFRYCQMSFFKQKLWKTLVPLGLSGLFMGFACASKWIGAYAAVGLAVLFFYTMYRRFDEYRFAKKNVGTFEGSQRRIAEQAVREYWKKTSITLGFCVLFFIVIPVLIYYFSYYWFLKPTTGLNPQSVIEEQIRMFSYHSGLTNDDHYFKSPWYEWPLIIKPMWYYSSDYVPYEVVSSISCMGNPAVWWVGLIAMIFAMGRLLGWMGNWLVRFKNLPDRSYLFVVIGFLSQYLPWVLVPRSTFIYHYFASVPFIILATVLLLNYLRTRAPRAYRPVWIGYLAIVLLLFIGFYPLMSGAPVSRDYAMLLRWFNWYNFKL